MEQDLNSVLDTLAATLGLQGTSLFAVLAILSIVCRLIGKSIPDDAIGWKGVVRKVAKVIGLYTSNRVTSGVSVADVSKVLLDQRVSGRDDKGRFTEINVTEEARQIKSSVLATLGALIMVLLLSGCATTSATSTIGDVTRIVCQNTDAAQMLLDRAAEGKNKRLAQKIIDAVVIACPFIGSQLDYRKAQAAGIVGY